MLGISSGELFFVALIALIVLGPERLPKATRFAGLWVRRARQQWNSVKDELERELAADELKRSLQDAQTALQDTAQDLRDTGEHARHEIETLQAELQHDPDVTALDPPPDPDPIPDPLPAPAPGDDRRDD